MPYKTFNEQIAEHVNYLQSLGLEIDEESLVVNEGDGHAKKWERCRHTGEDKPKHKDGECVYKTDVTTFKKGLCGIRTTCRVEAEFHKVKTYGLHPDDSAKPKLEAVSRPANHSVMNESHEQAARKAYGFWQYSDIDGSSDYLERKGVGAYGLRFKSTQAYGNTAVVPMYDEYGRLWSYQLLNPDGTKRMPRDARTDGLFHILKRPTDGQLIGIAEGYATAATCMELSNIPTVCAFSSENLAATTRAMLNLFPASPIVLFADNDRHLSKNIGLTKAKEAQSLNPERTTIAIPDFGDVPAAKDASDWNDLARIRGRDVVKNQIRNLLKTKTMAAMGD